MKIIIIGAGQVGGSLAEILTQEHHDITLIDLNKDRLNYYAHRLDIRTLHGHGSYPGILRKAGADTTDMLIAVSDQDEINIVAAQVAYSLFNIPYKLARIRSRHYFVRKDLFGLDHIPIDCIVSPEQIVSRLVDDLMRYVGALRVMDFAEGQLKLLVCRVSPRAKAVGSNCADLQAAHEASAFRVVSIRRSGCVYTDLTDVMFQANDQVYVLVPTVAAQAVFALFSQTTTVVRRVMVAGGGNIGGSVARSLQEHYQVKVIDRNRSTCEYLAGKLRATTVLQGDMHDANLLRDENVENMDAFLALSDDDAANIVAAIQAKQLGAGFTYALINRQDYVDIIDSGAIDVMLSPSAATIGSILAYVRQGDIKAVYPIQRGAAEILEAVVHGDKMTSKLVGRTICQKLMPSSVRLVAIVRDDSYFFDVEQVEIAAKDHLIFYLSDKRKVHDLEKWLQVSSGFF